MTRRTLAASLRRRIPTICACIAALAVPAGAQTTTRPATRPTTQAARYNLTAGQTPLCDTAPGLLRPAGHLRAGVEIARGLVPLNAEGQPDPAAGKIVLIAIGMSNTSYMFEGTGGLGNAEVAFMPRVKRDPSINPQLLLVNGAQPMMVTKQWRDPKDPVWTVADQRLAAAGATPRQVQVAWVKSSGAETDQAGFEAITRNIKARYPNCKLAYWSCRTFRFHLGQVQPSRDTYEEGSLVQAMIARQIQGDPTLNYDPARGPVTAPWLSWAAYLWNDGANPRSDGLVWKTPDTRGPLNGTNDGHPTAKGVGKNAAQLLAFFKTDPTATPWFLRKSAPGRGPQDVTATATPAAGPAPLTVQFSATARDGDGRIAEYIWTYGDGTFSFNPAGDTANLRDTLAMHNNPRPVKTFHLPGAYTAFLTVTDDAGHAVTRTVTITVTAPTSRPE